MSTFCAIYLAAIDVVIKIRDGAEGVGESFNLAPLAFPICLPDCEDSICFGWVAGVRVGPRGGDRGWKDPKNIPVLEILQKWKENKPKYKANPALWCQSEFDKLYEIVGLSE